MSESEDTILNRLPARLKAARREQGLSLEAVAKLSGVSRSMVSQIERGESSPTIATLWNLTQALQVDFAGLLDAEARDDRIEVVRSQEAPMIENRAAGYRITILSPPEDAGSNELYDLWLSSGGRLDSQPHRSGAREQLNVVSGMVEVRSGAVIACLGSGDIARYAADVEHSISAVDGEARAILVVRNA